MLLPRPNKEIFAAVTVEICSEINVFSDLLSFFCVRRNISLGPANGIFTAGTWTGPENNGSPQYWTIVKSKSASQTTPKFPFCNCSLWIDNYGLFTVTDCDCESDSTNNCGTSKSNVAFTLNHVQCQKKVSRSLLQLFRLHLCWTKAIVFTSIFIVVQHKIGFSMNSPGNDVAFAPIYFHLHAVFGQIG